MISRWLARAALLTLAGCTDLHLHYCHSDGNSSAVGGSAQYITIQGIADSGFQGSGYSVVAGSGAIVAITASSTHVYVAGKQNGDWLVVRLDLQGNLDPAFGSSGRVLLGGPGEDFASALGIAPGGKIYVAGSRQNATADAALVRLNNDGTVDTSFGSAGWAIFDGGSVDNAFGLVLDSQERIVVVGSSRDNSNHDHTVVLRYRSDGALDWSVLDTAQAGVNDGANAVDVDDSDRIIVSGYGQNAFTVRRFHVDGSLDGSFGNAGRFVLDHAARGATSSVAYGVRLETSGQILATGDIGTQMAVVRLSGSGTPDPSLGSGGVAIFSSGGTTGRGIALGPTGDFYVAGWTVDTMSVWGMLRDGTVRWQFTSAVAMLAYAVVFAETGSGPRLFVAATYPAPAVVALR